MLRGVSLSLMLVLALAGCAETTSHPEPKVQAAAASGVERYFPLEEGKIYHYVTKDGAETGMLVAKVHRTDATHGELRLSNATKRFVFGPNAVSYDGGGATLLQGPIEVGSSWKGEHGGTTKITSVDANVDVPAGHYASCVQTVEDGGRPNGARYEQTYCPGVGMVLLVVSAPSGEARAELKSYGMPVKIE